MTKYKLIDNKKGQVLTSLAVSKEFILFMVVLVAVSIVGILVAVQLRDSGIFTTGSTEYNDTTEIVANYTQGVKTFWQNVPTLFTILFVVVLVAMLALIIFAVTRFAGSSTSGEGL